MKLIANIFFSLLSVTTTTASIATAAFAQEARPLKVEARYSADNTVDIYYSTVASFSSMCYLKPIDLAVLIPVPNRNIGIPTPPVGQIAFSTTVDRQGLCMQAFGPHSGNVSLSVGTSEGVTEGYFRLVIDGVSYGILDISEDNVEVIEDSDLPQ